MNKKGSAMVITVIVLVAILLIGSGLVFRFWIGPKIFFKQVDVAHDIVDKTYTADNAIYNYEWFKTQNQKISASENQIDNTMMMFDDFKNLWKDKEMGWQAQEEYSRISTTLLGQRNHYENLVADYNARSEMVNRNIFQDKLPFSIDKKIW